MQNKLVIGNGKYKITDSITVTSETRAIFTNRIIYTGDSAAIIITGSYSDLYFYAVQSSAVGILFESTEGIAYNHISVNKMICTDDCLYMHAASSKGIFYNFFNFAYLDSGKTVYILKLRTQPTHLSAKTVFTEVNVITATGLYIATVPQNMALPE